VTERFVSELWSEQGAKERVGLVRDGAVIRPFSTIIGTPHLDHYPAKRPYWTLNCIAQVYPMSIEKITRTIRLTPEVNQRLVELCEHLGTNPNAYLISEIGKAVSRDEIAFRAQKSQNDLFATMAKMMEEAKDGDHDA